MCLSPPFGKQVRAVDCTALNESEPFFRQTIRLIYQVLIGMSVLA